MIKLARIITSLIAAGFILCGCASMVRLSPRSGEIVLVSKASTSSMNSDFRAFSRKEVRFIPIWDTSPFPATLLEESNSGKPLANVRVSYSPSIVWGLCKVLLPYAAVLGLSAAGYYLPIGVPFEAVVVAAIIVVPDLVEIEIVGDQLLASD